MRKPRVSAAAAKAAKKEAWRQRYQARLRREEESREGQRINRLLDKQARRVMALEKAEKRKRLTRVSPLLTP